MLWTVQANGKSQLRLLSVSHAMNHVYQLLTPTVAPALIIDYGAITAGLLTTSFLLSYSLLPVVSGYLTQYLGRRNILAFGYAVCGLSFVAVAFTNDLTLLVILFFIAGAAASTYHPNGAPILAETYPTSRGQTLGLHQMGGAVGSFVGPFVTGLLLASFPWRTTVIIMAMPGLVLAAVLWFSISPKKSSPDVGRPKANMRIGDLKHYGAAIIFIIAAFIYVLGQRGTDAFGNVYFTYGRGIQIAEATLLFSLLKIAGLFSAPICGKLSDIYGRKVVLITLVLVESASLYALTAVPTMILAVPCIVFGFAAFGLLTVGEALLADVTPEKQRATIFGINLTVNFSPYLFLTPILFALPGSYGYSIGFIALSLLMLLSIPLILRIKWKRSQPSQSV